MRAIAGDFRRCPHDWFPQCVGKRCPVATCDENFRTFAKVTSADLRGWESVIPPQPATKEHQTYTAGPPTPPSSCRRFIPVPLALARVCLGVWSSQARAVHLPNTALRALHVAAGHFSWHDVTLATVSVCEARVQHAPKGRVIRTRRPVLPALPTQKTKQKQNKNTTPFSSLTKPAWFSESGSVCK